MSVGPLLAGPGDGAGGALAAGTAGIGGSGRGGGRDAIVWGGRGVAGVLGAGKRGADCASPGLGPVLGGAGDCTLTG